MWHPLFFIFFPIMKKPILSLLLILIAASSFAQRPREYTPSPVQGTAWNTPGNINPIIPGYFADPTIRKFGDTYYIYATTDGTGNGYGPAQVWMSKDFVNWKNFVMNWPTTQVVWAPDVVQQSNGKYRYYYCEPCNVNIGESDSPIGPWHNILGKEDAVMVPDRYIHNVITLDPMLFTDDDGSQYLYFTTWGIYKGFGCGVAKLRDGDYDISALATKYRDARRWNENRPFPIAADEFFTEKKLILNDELKDIFEAPFVFKRNGIYYFTYSSGSCHTDTYRVQYATSTVSPMGPWQYKGELLTTNTDGTVHGPGHHSILEQDGNYYIVYHRHNIAKSVHGFNRQLCIDKMEFAPNGDILPIIPTHQGINPLNLAKQLTQPQAPNLAKRLTQPQAPNLAFQAKVTASSYYDEMHKPEYVADDNNATLWKAANTTWGKNPLNPTLEWVQLDLGKPKKFNEIWTQFEYPTFFYQYIIYTSLDGENWHVYSDRHDNTMQGSPMIDKKRVKARYIRLTITDTQKNGHMPAIWNIKVWNKAPELPSTDVESNDGYPEMHKKDIEISERMDTEPGIVFSADELAIDHTAPFDESDFTSQGFKSNKPMRVRVKDGKWGVFFNGTQHLTSLTPLPRHFIYNSPYTIFVRALSTKVGAVSTVASLTDSRADLATTQFRLGTDPAAGVINHNGSFESCGLPSLVRESEGTWHDWVVTYDGWKEKIYLDGKLVHEQNNFLMISPEGNITIGADGSGTNNFMGYINTVMIVPIAMSKDQISELTSHLSEVSSPLPTTFDDDFEEIDPDSKFTLNPEFTLQYRSKDIITLTGSHPDFNDSPLNNGVQSLRTITGDFVLLATIDDMEGLHSHSIKAYNEGGICLSDDNGTLYQYGAFPLYNCGNMLTILSPRGRPQHPNYKGYTFDRHIQFERRGNLLFARSSSDGKTWENNPGSPIELTSPTLTLGIYQTTYSETESWVKMKDVEIYSK